ncbi:MAG: FkbM family methyltransferase [Bacteroidia bacterium]|nr:FkbM family methyltransferase [Bacteroidia bacterium]
MKRLLKKIYTALPFKKNIFLFLKLFFKFPHSVYQHLYFRGFFKVKLDLQHSFEIFHPGTIEENDIFWNGIYNGWERKSMAIWIDLVKGSNKTILDIGANTGLYGLVAQSLNPSHTIHSFEPLPGVFKILQQNIERNKFNIKAHLFGLSDYDGKATVYLPETTDFAYSVSVNKNTFFRKNVIETPIDVKRLSTFIQENNITSIDLIKMDVETHEVHVLNGMGEYLKRFKPTFIIEVLEEEIAEKLNELFKDMGYLYFNIDDKNNSVRQTERITKSDYWNFLVCNEATAKKLNLI